MIPGDDEKTTKDTEVPDAMTTGEVAAAIAVLASQIEPLDAREEQDQACFVTWCRSGAPLFRSQAPAQHLVVYFVLLDAARRQVLLVDHRKAGLRLPPGGHVDEGEDPRAAVVRETAEELGVVARFHPLVGDRPLFVTATHTRGTGRHLDMTLWFLLDGDSRETPHGDAREFTGLNWESLDLDATTGYDPQWPRFRAKLTRRLMKRSTTGLLR